MQRVRLDHQSQEDQHDRPSIPQESPSVTIDDFRLSTVSSNQSLDAEPNKWIGKAATAMARLTARAWDNAMLTTNIKSQVYQACVLSTLFYGSEMWTLCSRPARGSIDMQ